MPDAPSLYKPRRYRVQIATSIFGRGRVCQRGTCQLAQPRCRGPRRWSALRFVDCPLRVRDACASGCWDVWVDGWDEGREKSDAEAPLPSERVVSSDRYLYESYGGVAAYKCRAYLTRFFVSRRARD